MCIYCIYSSPLFVSFHSRGIYQVLDVLDDDTDNHVQEYEEVEIVEKSVEPEQRSATGRVYTGNDCEYIKLGSITANDGCTNGEDKDLEDTDDDDDDFREQVCDKAGDRSEEAVPDPEWRSYPWVCDQGEEVCQLFILYRSYD